MMSDFLIDTAIKKHPHLATLLQEFNPMAEAGMTAREYLSKRIPYQPDEDCLGTVVYRLAQKVGDPIVIFALKLELQHDPPELEPTQERSNEIALRIQKTANLFTRDCEWLFDDPL